MANTKIIKLGKKGQIVLPKNLRDSIGAKENGMLLITAENGQIIITTPEQYGKLTCGLLKGLWGKTVEEIDSYIEEERNSWEEDK